MRKLASITLTLSMTVMMLAGCASGSGGSVSVAGQQKRQQALAATDHLIIPGERIGPIRLGMGMDEVTATLGQPDYAKQIESLFEWSYHSLNMVISFSGGAAPSVTQVITKVFHKHSKSYGEISWGVDQEPISTVFQTANGIGLGATSFDVKRAYSSSTYEDHEVWMDYKELGISFVVGIDHRIWSIGVRPRGR